RRILLALLDQRVRPVLPGEAARQEALAILALAAAGGPPAAGIIGTAALRVPRRDRAMLRDRAAGAFALAVDRRGIRAVEDADRRRVVETRGRLRRLAGTAADAAARAGGGGGAWRACVGTADATASTADARGAAARRAIGVVVARRCREVVAGVAETALTRLAAAAGARRAQRLGDRISRARQIDRQR